MTIDESLLTTPEFAWLSSYQIRSSQRARRLQLRISSLKGLEIIVPRRRYTTAQITTFILSKRNWIEKHLANLPILRAEQLPQKIEIPSEVYLLAIDEHWPVVTPSDFHKKLKLRAQKYLLASLNQLCVETGLGYKRLSIRLQKSRWGSCSRDNKISLNMGLLFLPACLVRYVLIHELCHTVHHNHLKRFWKLVSKFDANYRKHAYEIRRAMHLVPKWL